MSHVAAVECYVTDLADMRAAAAACGFELCEGQTTYEWFGTFMNDSDLARGHDPATFGRCQHALRLKDHRPGDYEIGLVPRVDGQPGWELLYDNWSTHGARIEARAGARLATLKDEIAAAASERVLRRQGYRVTRTVTETGEIQVRGTR